MRDAGGLVCLTPNCVAPLRYFVPEFGKWWNGCQAQKITESCRSHPRTGTRSALRLALKQVGAVSLHEDLHEAHSEICRDGAGETPRKTRT